MGESKITKTSGMYDLSHINTERELREEIVLLKAAVKKTEDELEGRLRQFPQKILKASADNLLPSFLNNLIASGTWKMLLGSLGMFANPFSSKFSFKKTVLGSAKKIGLFTLLKSAYGMWSNKKSSGAITQSNIKKSPEVTTLKARKVK